LGILAFLVTGTIITPGGTMSWIVSEIMPPSRFRESFLVPTFIGLVCWSITASIITHYFLLMSPAAAIRPIFEILEVNVVFFSMLLISVHFYTTVGRFAEEYKTTVYFILIPQYSIYAVALFHLTFTVINSI
jgi:hypothetical protein